jgi:signal transduction histidine kinase/CheY-like chemotaxis protein
MAEETILIVDDDKTTVTLCQRILERASYHVLTAMDPLLALQTMRKVHLDLLLSDIRMPVMDGFELIRQAQEIQPGLPVLVMTGYGSIENAIQALHRGVDGLIVKPFANTSVLAQTVQQVIEESRQKRDAARLQVLRPLFDVTEHLLGETSPETLEKLILSKVKELFHSSYSGISRQNYQANVLKGIQVIRDSELLEGRESLEQFLRTSSETNSPVLLSVGALDGGEGKQILSDLGLESLIAAPVQRNSWYTFYACREASTKPFTEADLEMFVILARQAAVALENAQLYTELKENVRRVEESQRALIQAEKMAAVGRLVASMAHEINNPLQAVRNCLHLAARKGVHSDQRFRYLEMMDIELDRLVQTVKQMLDFYRPGSSEKELVSINTIVNQVLELLKPQFRDQNIQIRQRQVGQPGTVNVVPGQIQQVIFNLLINAMEAIEEASRETGNSGGSKEIWIDIFNENDVVRLLIEDSGLGINDILREQIFEPFNSTKQNGTGLGLSVSYSIMERHEGRLALIPSRYGAGACFEIKLPLGEVKENGKSINR